MDDIKKSTDIKMNFGKLIYDNKGDEECCEK